MFNYNLKPHQKRYNKNLQKTDKESLIIKDFLEKGVMFIGEEYDRVWDKFCQDLGNLNEKQATKKLIEFKGENPELIKCFEEDYNEDYFTGEIISMYKYIITRISEENNIPLDEIKLQISHKLKTGRSIKTSLSYPVKYSIHNLDEILNLLDAEETTQQIRIGKHTHFLEIKDKEKEKQLYKDEKEWREQKYGKQ